MRRTCAAFMGAGGGGAEDLEKAFGAYALLATA